MCMAGWILLAIVVVLLLWSTVSYNSLVGLRNQVKNAWNQIDVQLKRRYDLIPNLVEVVKGYMTFEQETLQKVIQARNMAMQAQGPRAQAEAEGMLSGALKSLFALVESYPDLKANQNVSRLQEELTSTENKIAFARQFYNDSVMGYNNAIQMFPSNFIAGMFQFKAEEFFHIPETEKAPVKVSLR
ncbi:MAG TPA: LemA family protein [Nitrospiria bacterium]|nr:LemA family protein [Nitrospiria bacterium]